MIRIYEHLNPRQNETIAGILQLHKAHTIKFTILNNARGIWVQCTVAILILSKYVDLQTW